MQEEYVIILNAGLYIALFCICLWKLKWSNLSTLISLFYVICSTCSLLLYYSPLYLNAISSVGKCTINACLYLYSINLMLILAFRRCSLDNIKIITNYNAYIINRIQQFLCIAFIIILIFQLPESIGKFFSGRNLSDMRDELYGTNSSGDIFIIGIIGRLFGACTIPLIAITCIKALIFKQNDKWNKISFVVYILIKVNTILGVISRATIIFSVVELFVIFCFFRRFLSHKAKRQILLFCLIIGPLTISTLNIITTARFDSKYTVEKEFTFLRYAGESHLNFMALAYPDLKKPFWGYSPLTLYRRILGLPYNDGLSREGSSVYDSYIQKATGYRHPTYIFYSLGGVLYLNFGKYGALVLALVFYYLMSKSFTNRYRMSISQIIFISVFAPSVIKGIFGFEFSSEGGNLLFIYLIILYSYLSKHGYTVQLYNKYLRRIRWQKPPSRLRVSE